MTSLGKPVARHARTTSAIGSSSFSAGMITTRQSRQFITGPARRGEIENERKKIGQRERDRAGGNFRIEFQPVEKRRNAEAKKAGRDKRNRRCCRR